MFRHLFNPKSFHRGVTLIEVMAVIAIMSILAAVTLVSWTESRSRQDLILAEREFTAIVRQAQGYALTGKLDMNHPDWIPCSYQIQFVDDTEKNKYKTRYTYYESGGSCDAPSVADIQTFTLPNGVAFSDFGDINFFLPSGQREKDTPSSVSFTKSTASGIVCLPTSTGILFSYSIVNDGGSCPN